MTAFVGLKEILALWLADDMQGARFFALVAVTTAIFFLYATGSSFGSFLASKLGVGAGKAIQGVIHKKQLRLSSHHLAQ